MLACATTSIWLARNHLPTFQLRRAASDIRLFSNAVSRRNRTNQITPAAAHPQLKADSPVTADMCPFQPSHASAEIWVAAAARSITRALPGVRCANSTCLQSSLRRKNGAVPAMAQIRAVSSCVFLKYDVSEAAPAITSALMAESAKPRANAAPVCWAVVRTALCRSIVYGCVINESCTHRIAIRTELARE